MQIEHDKRLELLSQSPFFNHLNEPDLIWLAGLFQVEIVLDGQAIFDIDDASEDMFILCEGQISLVLDKQGVEDVLANLQRGDIFGEEALLYDDPRYYRAVARGKTVLLRLNVENYDDIYEDLPGIDDMLEVSIQSRQLSTQVSLPWLHEDEYVHVMSRRHPAILWNKLVGPIVIGIGILILSALIQWIWLTEKAYGWITLFVGLPAAILWITWLYFDWRNDYFIVTNKRVVWIEKVALVYESRQEAPLRTIMSVGTNRSRIGSLLDYADVVVMTYVGMIRLQNLANAEAVASLIESYWHRSESINRREEAQMMAQKLQEKLDLPWDDDEDTRVAETRGTIEEPVRFEKEPGFFTWLFSDFIRLRYELNGTITYRKHWFVLVEKTWLPAILMLLTLVGITGRLGGWLSFIPMTTAIVFLLLFGLVILIWVVYQYADWRNDIFKVTLDQIVDIDRKPLGKIRRRAAPLENVLSIEYERLGFWGYLLNFGTVYITVGNMKLSFDHVYNPSEVQQDIFYRMGERLGKVRQFEIDSERERVSEWIASYHRKTQKMQRMNDDHSVDGEDNF